MIKYLQEKYNIKPSDTSRLPELVTMRKTVEEYRKKYPSEDKEMEVSSSDSDVDSEEKRRSKVSPAPSKVSYICCYSSSFFLSSECRFQ